MVVVGQEVKEIDAVGERFVSGIIIGVKCIHGMYMRRGENDDRTEFIKETI